MESLTTRELSDFFDANLTAYSQQQLGKQSNYKQWFFVQRDTETHKIVGAIRGETMWQVAHIDLLIVEPNRRKQGVGTALFNRVLQQEKPLLITVETFDFQAPQYWLNKGFRIDFIREGYDGNKLYYMSLKLNQ